MRVRRNAACIGGRASRTRKVARWKRRRVRACEAKSIRILGEQEYTVLLWNRINITQITDRVTERYRRGENCFLA